MAARQGDNEAEAGEAVDVAMPIHDWTKVDPGIWHHFTRKWIAERAAALNVVRTPRTYYALAEQKEAYRLPPSGGNRNSRLRPTDLNLRPACILHFKMGRASRGYNTQHPFKLSIRRVTRP